MSRLETPLAILAKERRWRVCVEDDGAGVAEIAPGITLEIDRRGGVGWTIGIEIRLHAKPVEIGDVTSLAEAFHAAARAIRGAGPAQLAKSPVSVRARMLAELEAAP